MWQTVRSTSRTSLAESLLPSCASVHSRHSTRNSLPGVTDAAGGMSGCQRLWPGTAWSAIDLDWSTLKTTSGIGVLLWVGASPGRCSRPARTGFRKRAEPGQGGRPRRCARRIARPAEAAQIGSPRTPRPARRAGFPGVCSGGLGLAVLPADATAVAVVLDRSAADVVIQAAVVACTPRDEALLELVRPWHVSVDVALEVGIALVHLQPQARGGARDADLANE